ncbi:hypothetical protein K1T71_002665 [Dendrolimus kikuchii]|uniref:Uncharacterized protein n=1 Tax=Dendrolimus kikuchii TaxID=765133 RepID=A0ACC1DDB5_9NEOP|nr:hypothetical protein K1T71_002665 [Dendrolimus kikuchii]
MFEIRLFALIIVNFLGSHAWEENYLHTTTKGLKNILRQDGSEIDIGIPSSDEQGQLNSNIYPLHGSLNTDETSNGMKRPLVSGDLFAAVEMLPITQKLYAKVERPGEGRGIVSSAKNPQDMADKLFKVFFFTDERILKLKDFDITGLDALQALALNGEKVADMKTPSNVLTKRPIKFIKLKGGVISTESQPKKSRYMLLSKRKDAETGYKSKNLRKGLFRGIKLAEKLKKNRRLVVKGGRRQSKNNYDAKIKKKRPPRIEEYIKQAIKSNNDQETVKNVDLNMKTSRCRWKYECRNPSDLETCQLHTQCIKGEKLASSQNGFESTNNENNDSVRQFRRMVGITVLDEEVEKIIERRALVLFPVNTGTDYTMESLSQYFNNIIRYMEAKDSTPAPEPNIVELSDQSNKENNILSKKSDETVKESSSNEN